MTELTGYFDGTVCIPYSVENLKPQQKVKIIVLDEFVPQKRDLKRFVGQISISDAEVMEKTVSDGRRIDENEW